MNTKKLLYYIDEICRKIDLHTDAFIERIEYLKQGDTEKVEFIEKMMLEPLEQQIKYLAKKATDDNSKEK